MRSSWAIAAGLTLALGAWLATPYVLPAKEVEMAESETAAPAAGPVIMTVQTRLSRAQAVNREIVLNGRSEAARRVTLRAEIDARVVDLPKDKGDYVSAGAVVAALDERDKRAWEKRAAAMVREHEITYDAARKLGQKGFQAETKVAQALAQLEEARAILEQSRFGLDHATVEASFAGLLEDRLVEIGDFVKIGDPLAEIVELDPLTVTVDVPEMHYHRFTGKTSAQVQLAGFDKREGKVTFLSSEADPGTRTFHLEIELPNPDLSLPAGVTTQVSLAFEAEQAHPLPPSLLSLDDAGRIGIKYVDTAGHVLFSPAEIVKSSVDTIWLAGLPSEIEVITIGQGFVKPGETVKAVRVDDDEAETQPLLASQ